VLEAARPGQFVGVPTSRWGALRTQHNPVTRSQQFLSQVAGLGFSQPQNVDAVQVLAQGWINDCTTAPTPASTGDLGSTIDIPTNAGTAAGLRPAGGPHRSSPFIDVHPETLIDSASNLNFAYCATSPSASADTLKQPTSSLHVQPATTNGV